MKNQNDRKKKSFGGELLMVITMMQFFAAGVVMAMCIDKMGTEDKTIYVFSAGTMILSYFLATVIHEAGHLVGGLLTGYKFACFRIFSLSWSCGKDGKIRMGRITTPGMGGQCLMSPPALKDGKMPFMLYHAGGFLMNLIFAGLFAAAALLLGRAQYVTTGVWGVEFLSRVPISTGNIMGELICWMMAIMNLGSALINGIPIKTPLINNDGQNMIDLRRSTDALRRNWVDMKIAAGIWQNERLRDMPDEWFDCPSDEQLHDNPMHVGSAMMYYSRLMDEAGEKEQCMAQARELSGRLLADGVQLVGLHRALLRMDRAFMEMLEDTPLEYVRREQIDTWLDKPTRQVMQAMKKGLTVLRIEYANALLIAKDEAKAKKIKTQFEKMLRKYPVLTDIESEKGLVALVDRTYERRKAQENIQQ